jgi:hypothetical protein
VKTLLTNMNYNVKVGKTCDDGVEAREDETVRVLPKTGAVDFT